jgi:hypothetical protein
MTTDPNTLDINRVLEAVDGLPIHDALKTLNNATAQLLDTDDANNELLTINTTQDPASRLLFFGPGRKSKIHRYPEVRRFVHEAAGSMTLFEIQEKCVKQFGEERSPSTSAIGRYIHKLRNELRRGERK